MAELIAQRAHHRSIQGQIVDFEEIENGGQRIAAEAVGGVDNDLRLDVGGGGADAVLVDRGKKALDIAFGGVGRIVDLTDFIEKGAAEIFAGEAAFDGAFGGPALIEALAVHETDVDDALVEGAEADVYAGGGGGVRADEMTGDGHRHLAEIPDVDAGAGQAAHEGAYEHAGAAV